MNWIIAPTRLAVRRRWCGWVGQNVPALVAQLACLLGVSLFWKPADSAWAATMPALGDVAPIQMLYPKEGVVFPPDLVAPRFQWADGSVASEWEVTIGERGNLVFRVAERAWTPGPTVWEQIKLLSRERMVVLGVTGYRGKGRERACSHAQLHFQTSQDEVGAPIFYREVILPFIEAIKDSSRIRWRLGSISSPERPHVVLEGVPVCGNCHSFPKDASVLAMDVDYANSKGSYVIAPIARHMALRPKDVISWDDFRREDGEQTFGLLSQISPDGQRVVSTVKDQSVFMPKPDLEFSQLFFPLKGILAIYDRRSRSFHALPGADDPDYVQSNPSWSPDGNFIVFARAKAYQLRKAPAKGRALLTPDECEEFLKEGKTFQFDLYRIPYNEGKGGVPQPLEGASGDGFSNYFAKYSPDGKWIVFCKARSYMLLQPDSELYLIPSGGGRARRLAGNTSRMNSWHSWSPNSHWLVFSSKANGPYTQLFLTHLDDQGESAPPVLLAQFTAPDRAANIPEFVRLAPGDIETIDAEFLDDYSHARAGFAAERAGDADGAIRQYERALQLNPDNPHAHERLAHLLYHAKHQRDAALEHGRQAVRLNPASGQAHFVLGQILLSEGDSQGAARELLSAERGVQEATDPNYTALAAESLLGLALLMTGDAKASSDHLREAIRLDPTLPEAQYYLAVALARQGLVDEPRLHFQEACRLRPALEGFPEVYDLLSQNLAKAGKWDQAIKAAREALAGARRLGRADLAAELQRRLETYQAAQEHSRAP
jgi:tetratricopeptide (TPR) repeat protein